MTATTFDTLHRTNTTMSGGNLVATSAGAGGTLTTRFMSGKTYFEMTPTTVTGTPSVGIARSDWNTILALPSGTSLLGYLATGAVQVNGVTLATIATWAAGNRIDCATDPLNKLIWFRVAGGNWNNNALNDPATGVGGIDYSSMNEGAIAAAVFATLTGNVWTAKFSTPFTGTPPTGFSSLDAVGYTVANATINEQAAGYGAVPSSDISARPGPKDQTDCGKHFTPGGVITVVSGTTKESGVAVAGRLVEVFDRLTGDRLGYALSDGSGNWSIPCLGRPAVRVVGSDPTTYNSLVYDNVVPV